MHKCINQKQAIDEHQTEPRDLVQSEAEHSQDNDNHNEDEEEKETKLGMWCNFVLSTFIGYLDVWVCVIQDVYHSKQNVFVIQFVIL